MHDRKTKMAPHSLQKDRNENQNQWWGVRFLDNIRRSAFFFFQVFLLGLSTPSIRGVLSKMRVIVGCPISVLRGPCLSYILYIYSKMYNNITIVYVSYLMLVACVWYTLRKMVKHIIVIVLPIRRRAVCELQR